MNHRATIHYGVLLATLLPPAVRGAEIAAEQLPAPTTATIEFDRDVKPIFESVCFRCHGPEKPKARFRLDNREAALKGGENNQDDIVPGDSAKSKLIHYVARLVEDMEMPPPGKGEPLTPEQIGLLRAWIDQGAKWAPGSETAVRETKFSVTPTASWITVSGNAQKFREDWWRKEGFTAGYEKFELIEPIGKQAELKVEGRALFDQNDYRVALTLSQPDLGFVRAGYDTFRKYFNDTGGYYAPFNQAPLSLGRDLHEDIGKAWFDVGLTLPDWPKIVVGYEYQFREGEESLLQWGPVGGVGMGAIRNIAPAYKAVDESTHIIKLDASHEVSGLLFEESFRGEFYDLSTRQNTFSSLTGAPALTPNSQVEEGYSHFAGANALRLEEQVLDWLFLSGGYLYRKLDGDATLSQPIPDLSLSGRPTASPRIVLDQQTHIFNANAQLGPWDSFSLFGGAQIEWNRQKGNGEINLDFDFDSATTVTNGTVFSDLDKFSREEIMGVRYTKIPFTVLFAEARLQQEDIRQHENAGDLDSGAGVTIFERDTEASSDLREVRGGFSFSPWTAISLSGQYKRSVRDSDYDHLVDTNATPFGVVSPGDGYSAFIRNRKLATDEIEAKLAWRVNRWLKTTFTYQLVATDYHTTTDPAEGIDQSSGDLVSASPGGRFFSGNYDAQVYSLNALLTPWRRLYLSGTFSYRDTRLTTSSDTNSVVVPYRGDVYSVVASATYTLNPATDLQATYSFSRADYRQNNQANGLPLGIYYQLHGLEAGLTRRLGKNVTTQLKYGFYRNNDASSAGANNYTAHALIASLSLRLP